jgi:hypothetical protein
MDPLLSNMLERDLALTNGLLAVAAAAIPGDTACTGTGPTHRHGTCQNGLVSAFREGPEGITLVPTAGQATDLNTRMRLVKLGYERKVPVDVDHLLDAL